MSMVNSAQIMKQFQSSMDSANAANESRYKDLLGSITNTGAQVGSTYDQALARLADMGKTVTKRTNRDYANLQSQSEQGLISRGLGNTTIRSSNQRGIETDRQFSLQGIAEAVANQQSGVLQNRASAETNIGGMMANAIEGRTDAGPNAGLYAQLLSQIAESTGQRTTTSVGRGMPSGGGGGGSRSSFGEVSPGQMTGAGTRYYPPRDPYATNSNTSGMTAASIASGMKPVSTITMGAEDMGPDVNQQAMGTNPNLIDGRTKEQWQAIYDRGAGLVSENYDIWTRAKQALGK